LNVLGEVVGVNVAIRAGAQNIGFALPVDFVIPRAASLIAGRRGHGLSLRDAVNRDATESAARRSVSVAQVEPGSPAAAAGFKPGDVVERVDDIAVVTSIDFERGLLEKGAGQKVAVRVSRGPGRDGAATDLELVLQPAAKVPLGAAEAVWKKLGVKVAPVGAEAVAKANPQLRGGLLVTDVAAGSVAAAAGIQKGDVLVGLHLWETLNPDNVTFVLNHKDLSTFLPLKYFVAREGKLKDGWIASVP
jgi:serine protease Do